MSRSLSDVNAKNIHLMICDLGWLAFQTLKRKARDRVMSWMLLTFFFTSFFKLDRFFFLYVKDSLVHIECEAVFRPRMPIFFTW